MMKLMKSYRWSLLLALFVMAGCSDDDDETLPPPAGEGNLRLVEVDVQNSEIELRNFGDAAIDLSGYYICNLKSYAELSTLTNDDLTIDPDETIILNRPLDGIASDVGIYRNNTDFTDPVNMVDFMQYGADVGSNGRVDVAVSKGIWTTGDFVEGGSEFQYNGNGSNNGASFWSSTGVEGGDANVRIVSVDPSSDEVTLRNFGDAAIDVSGFWICNLKGYAQVNSLTTGDFTLDPDETISLSRELNDNASDVGLYLNDDGFANADNMVDFMQYGADVGTDGRVDVAVTKGIWTAGEFVEGNIDFNYTGDGSDNGASFWSSTGARTSNVRLASIDPVNNELTLKNFGEISVDISGLWICNLKSYAQVNTLTAEDLTLDPNETITLSRVLNESASDVGLYLNNDGFANADNIVDFMQYGDDIGSDGRVNVAVTKGIWSEGDYVNGVGPYTYEGNGDENGLASWDVTAEGSANVRLFAIDPSTDEVTLKNFGNASSNISTYWFCRRFDYSEVGTLSATSGNFILAPNEEITITVSMDDTSSDMGFYRTNSFASAAAMIDFMQYGEAGIGRESVADTRGIWSAGDFVANPGPFSYTGDGTTTGASTWD